MFTHHRFGIFGHEHNEVVTTECRSLLINKGIDTAIDGDVKNDCEATDENCNNREQSTHFVAEKIMVGSTNSFKNTHYLSPFLVFALVTALDFVFPFDLGADFLVSEVILPSEMRI